MKRRDCGGLAKDLATRSFVKFELRRDRRASLDWQDQTTRSVRPRRLRPDTRESRLRDSAAWHRDNAVRNDNPAATHSGAAPCLRWFAIAAASLRLSPSASEPIAADLRCTDASAARTIHRPAILRQFFPCTLRPRDRRLPPPRRGHA